jgi:integrase
VPYPATFALLPTYRDRQGGAVAAVLSVRQGTNPGTSTGASATAKVPVITVHGTRKTCGSLLAALDVHPRVAMQILRHSKIAVTMEIYTEVPSAATREALSKLSQWLDSDS